MAIHKFVFHNGDLREAGERILSPGQLGLLAGWGVFTTLRVMEGALFAWERHWDRMSRDARLLNVAMPAGPAELERGLMNLVEANGHPDCTMRLVVVRNAGGFWEGPPTGRESDVLALTADLNQWGESVRLRVQPNARFAASEFSGTKILSWAQNLRWVERAHHEGFDETLLLNERGTIAECTSANVFAVQGNVAVTPPLTDGCLPGVTREILLEARIPGIEVTERSVRVEELYDADEAFITSTTRDLLAIAQIGERRLKTGGTVRERLSRYFEEYLKNDIARREGLRKAV